MVDLSVSTHGGTRFSNAHLNISSSNSATNKAESNSNSAQTTSTANASSQNSTTKIDFAGAKGLADKVSSGDTKLNSLSKQEQDAVRAFNQFEQDFKSAQQKSGAERGNAISSANLNFSQSLNDINSGRSPSSTPSQSANTDSSNSAASATQASTASQSNPAQNTEQAANSNESGGSTQNNQTFDYSQARELQQQVASGEVSDDDLTDQQRQVVAAVNDFDTARESGGGSFSDLSSQLNQISENPGQTSASTQTRASQSDNSAQNTEQAANSNENGGSAQNNQTFDYSQARELQQQVANGEVGDDDLTDQQRQVVAAVNDFDTARESGGGSFSDLSSQLNQISENPAQTSGSTQTSPSQSDNSAQNTEQSSSSDESGTSTQANQSFDYSQARELQQQVANGEVSDDDLTDQQRQVVAAVNDFDTARESGGGSFSDLSSQLNQISESSTQTSTSTQASAPQPDQTTQNSEQTTSAGEANTATQANQSFDYAQARELQQQVANGEVSDDDLTDQQRQVVAAVNQFDQAEESGTNSFSDLTARLAELSQPDQPAQQTTTQANTEQPENNNQPGVNRQAVSFQLATAAALFGESQGNFINTRQ